MDPPSQRSSDWTRREFLKAGTATFAIGITTSTSGCLSGLPPLGQKQTYGRVDLPPADKPTYRSWLPAPASFDTAGSHYRVTYAQPSPIEGDEPEEFLGRRAIAKTNIDYFGIGYEQYDSYLETEFGTVIEADFEVPTVADALTQSGYDSDGAYQGYDLFSRSDVPRRVAVRNGTIVWSSHRIHRHPSIEALIDTKTGSRQRYHNASPSFKRISDAIGASRMVLIGPNFGSLTSQAELGAIGFRFADDAVYQVINLLFPEGDVPTIEQFERDVRDVEEWTREADVFDIDLDSRLGLVETRIPTQGSTDRSPFIDPPQVTWGVSHDTDAETLTVHHEAGETIDADLLWADINTESIPGTVKPLWEEDERVAPGDSDTIDLSSADLRPDLDTTQVEAIPDSAQANITNSVETATTGLETTESDTITLDEVTRVDIILAEHRSYSVGDWRRLFTYKLE